MAQLGESGVKMTFVPFRCVDVLSVHNIPISNGFTFGLGVPPSLSGDGALLGQQLDPMTAVQTSSCLGIRSHRQDEVIGRECELTVDGEPILRSCGLNFRGFNPSLGCLCNTSSAPLRAFC